MTIDQLIELSKTMVFFKQQVVIFKKEIQSNQSNQSNKKGPKALNVFT